MQQILYYTHYVYVYNYSYIRCLDCLFSCTSAVVEKQHCFSQANPLLFNFTLHLELVSPSPGTMAYGHCYYSVNPLGLSCLMQRIHIISSSSSLLEDLNHQKMIIKIKVVTILLQLFFVLKCQMSSGEGRIAHDQTWPSLCTFAMTSPSHLSL